MDTLVQLRPLTPLNFAQRVTLFGRSTPGRTRYICWVGTRFLWRGSKFDLFLTSTHLDGAMGLAFLGKRLIPFSDVLFALTAVVSRALKGNILFARGKRELLSEELSRFLLKTPAELEFGRLRELLSN